MLKKFLYLCLLLLSVGFIIPENPVIPVYGASERDWNPRTFWFEPWGSSGVHKGIDIFASKGTKVLAPTNMIVLYQGNIAKGGKVVLALGAGWRFHYFAHLQEFADPQRRYYEAGQEIGTVGDSGNAKGKPPHLHYSILSLLPRPWRADLSTQGYKKMFYLDPGEYLQKH